MTQLQQTCHDAQPQRILEVFMEYCEKIQSDESKYAPPSIYPSYPFYLSLMLTETFQSYLLSTRMKRYSIGTLTSVNAVFGNNSDSDNSISSTSMKLQKAASDNTWKRYTLIQINSEVDCGCMVFSKFSRLLVYYSNFYFAS
ncbi:MAG: hypothetical protein SGBAC_004020 [Bacillariaceae sp.]